MLGRWIEVASNRTIIISLELVTDTVRVKVEGFDFTFAIDWYRFLPQYNSAQLLHLLKGMSRKYSWHYFNYSFVMVVTISPYHQNKIRRLVCIDRLHKDSLEWHTRAHFKEISNLRMLNKVIYVPKKFSLNLKPVNLPILPCLIDAARQPLPKQQANTIAYPRNWNISFRSHIAFGWVFLWFISS